MGIDSMEGLPVSQLKNAESLRQQLRTFQEHLAEVDAVIGELTKHSSPEVESFWLIRTLIVRRMTALRSEIEGANRALR